MIMSDSCYTYLIDSSGTAGLAELGNADVFGDLKHSDAGFANYVDDGVVVVDTDPKQYFFF